MTFIGVDATALRRASDVALEAGHDLLREAVLAQQAVSKDGLPGYAKNVQAAATDLSGRGTALLHIAAVLRAKAALAVLAAQPGSFMLMLRLRQLEYSNPDLYMDLLDSFVQTALGEAGAAGGGFAAVKMSEMMVRAGLEVPDAEMARIRNQLGMEFDTLAKRWKYFSGKSGLAVSYGIQRGKITAGALAGRLSGSSAAGKVASGVFGQGLGVLIGVGGQWLSDRDETLSAAERRARLRNAGIGALAAGGATAAICIGTGGLGCVLLAGTATGLVSGGVVNEVNSRNHPTAAEAKMQRLEAQARQLGKLHQFYIQNGRPTEAFLSDVLYETPTRTEEASDYVDTGKYDKNGRAIVVHYETVRYYRLPDNTLAAVRVYEDGGVTSQKFYDLDEVPIKARK